MKPSPTSTSVIVSGCAPVVVLRGGANTAAPITPRMIAAIARCS